MFELDAAAVSSLTADGAPTDCDGSRRARDLDDSLSRRNDGFGEVF